MNPSNEVTERAAFEAVARTNPYKSYAFALFAEGRIKAPPRTYLDMETEAAWLLWKAARATLPPASGEVVAWAVMMPDGGVEKIGNSREWAEKLARYMGSVDHQKRQVRPLVFGDATQPAAPEMQASHGAVGKSEAALQALVDQAQELDMGYGTGACGGCGNSDPAKRCIGCRHEFSQASPSPSATIVDYYRRAVQLAAAAEADGFIVTVTAVARRPLAMGNFDLVVDVRESSAKYRRS